MKYISIDLETSGLNPEQDQILEFGAVLEDTNNVKPIDELPYYQCYVFNTENRISGHPAALEMNAGIISKLKNKDLLANQYNFVHIEDLSESFLFWLMHQGVVKTTVSEYEIRQASPITVAGKNFSGFDSAFLNKVPLWNEHIKTRSRVLDPGTLFVDWKSDDVPPSLSECKKRAGIEGAVQHTAIDDCYDVIKLLRTQYIQ